VGLIEGALILLAGILLGRFLPGRRRGPEPAEAVCGCRHHYAVHDPQAGRCGATAEISLYNTRGERLGWQQVPCPCARYTGPEPLPEYVAAGIAEG